MSATPEFASAIGPVPRSGEEGSSWSLGMALGVFTRPYRLFARFGPDAPWVQALAVSVVIGIVVIVALPDRVLYEGMQGATTRRGVPVEITSSPAIVALFERVRLSMGVVAAQPMLAAMLAGLLALTFSTVKRGTARFRQYLAVTAHAFLISAAGGLLGLFVQITTGRWEWQPSLAAIMPETAAGGWLAAAAFANPFTIWMLVVIGAGVAAINGWKHVVFPVSLILLGYAALAAGVGVIGG